MIHAWRGAILAVFLSVLPILTAGAVGPSIPGANYGDWLDEKDREDDAPPSEFKLINYFFVRGSFTNMLGDPSGLKGVSLGPIGVTGGSATRVTPGSQNAYLEQRWIPVLEYSPLFVDNLATFRAQFEIDYLWGRAANTVQQNEGGGFNADQVNLQTKNVNVAIHPTRDPNDLTIVLGTQSIYDSVYDPARTPLSDVIRTGYKLTYFGTDATGISLYSTRYGPAKVSFIPMQTAQPDKAAANDARLKYVYLVTADYTFQPAPSTNIGLSAWYLRDETRGDAFAYEGLVRSGPASAGLPGFVGTTPLRLERPNGHVFYVGANFHHNLDFRTGPLSATGFVMANFGRFTSTNPSTALNPAVDLRGFSANLELAHGYGRTTGDQLTLEGIFASGDSNPGDDTFTAPFTTNYYGLPGAVWFNHRSLLLFPFTSTVSNYTGAVTDISNQGSGLIGGIATASHDVVPNKLNVKLGVAAAGSAVRPPDTVAGVRRGKFVGAEVNAEVKYHLTYLMTVGLHGAYMVRGSFFDGNDRVTANPWAAFTTYTWYGF